MRWLLVLLLTVIFSSYASMPALATQPSLKIQPLEYREELAVGEKKKGFVDISNPTRETQNLTIDVQAFKQVNNKGELVFYDNEQISKGIIPDYTTFNLGPRQVLRLMFLVDGSKLPQGNVFAALFVSSVSKNGSSASGGVRVGTLLSLVNQTPPSQKVNVNSLEAPILQIGSTITGSLNVQNMEDPKKATGVYPRLTLRIDPFFATETKFEGPLVFPGIAREKSFTIDENRLGLYRLVVLDGRNNVLATQWFFAMTGWTKVAVVGVLFLCIGYGIHLYQNRKLQLSQPKKVTSKRKASAK